MRGRSAKGSSSPVVIKEHEACNHTPIQAQGSKILSVFDADVVLWYNIEFMAENLHRS
jgi:hypothetical protein